MWFYNHRLTSLCNVRSVWWTQTLQMGCVIPVKSLAKCFHYVSHYFLKMCPLFVSDPLIVLLVEAVWAHFSLFNKILL